MQVVFYASDDFYLYKYTFLVWRNIVDGSVVQVLPGPGSGNRFLSVVLVASRCRKLNNSSPNVGQTPEYVTFGTRPMRIQIIYKYKLAKALINNSGIKGQNRIETTKCMQGRLENTT